MKSIIICEGETDFTLLQYFMIKTNGWADSGNITFRPNIVGIRSRDFIKDSSILTITSANGCANIKEVFSSVIKANENVISEDEKYSKVCIVTDNDEDGTEAKIISDLNSVVGCKCEIKNNRWAALEFNDFAGNNYSVELLLLVIPFDENGALETFLLNSVSKQDEYDAEIIRKGNAFVDNADPNSRYLAHRGLRTKAKFDVYFSIRTPAKQFRMRQDILKDVPWEEYENVRELFKELKRLG